MVNLGQQIFCLRGGMKVLEPLAAASVTCGARVWQEQPEPPGTPKSGLGSSTAPAGDTGDRDGLCCWGKG